MDFAQDQVHPKLCTKSVQPQVASCWQNCASAKGGTKLSPLGGQVWIPPYKKPLFQCPHLQIPENEKFGALWKGLKKILTTPTPHISKKYAPKIWHKTGGSYGIEIPWNKGISTENVVHEPTFTPYELRLLWHTDPPFYAIWTVFMGGWGWSLICWGSSISRDAKLQGDNNSGWGCGYFAYNWKLPAYSGASLLTIDNFSFFAYSFSFFTYSWSFFAYSGKVRLIRALRDCKQRNLTVSKKAPTVSKKTSPIQNAICQNVSVATPAEPRGEKKLFFVQILGGEKLLNLVEKCRWNIFKRPERG